MAARAAVAAALLAAVASADESDHAYTDGEAVVLWLSKVGPYHNPQETYSYYALPFCKPAKKLTPETRIGGLGEILEGNDLVNSDVPLHFRKEVSHAPVCSMTLDDDGAKLLQFAVSNHYWYQMFVDELPVWGMVGEIVADEDAIEAIESHLDRPHGIADATFLYTHKNFTISYNGINIIEVNMTSEAAVPIEPGHAYDLTYSVHWVEAPEGSTFETRFKRYLLVNFFEHQIHWFSLFNSFMMVVFLCGLVALILMRTLKADYARYMREELLEEGEGGAANAVDRGMGDDSGWKQVHGDVFRRPAQLELFAALTGSGTQLLLLAALTMAAALAGSLYVDRGAVTKAAVVGYALTSAVAGFTSGRYYRSQFFPEPSPNWIRVMLLTACLFPAAVVAVISLLNAIALGYGTSNALSFWTIARVFVIWAFVSLPLVIGGTILGRRFTSKPQAPTRINAVPRPIPPRPWYASSAFVCLLAGLLPFGSIFIETYFVFTSFWNYKFYYVYGFMLAVYIILAIVVSCVTVVATYFLLNAEDHRWAWHAFASGASTAVYVFLYAVYYFLFRTEMTGFLQTAFYFGYTALACTALGLMTGAVGTAAASTFVRAIFTSIKVD